MTDDAPWRDEEVMRDLYWGRMLPPSLMAEELPVSKRTIQKWLNKLPIEQRSKEENMKLAWARNPANYCTETHGYERWEVWHNYERYYCFVHRLQAVAEWGFDAVCDMHVHHENGIKWDNRIDNLELLTPGEHAELHFEDRDDIGPQIGLIAQHGEEAVAGGDD